ncbi:MAG TPA: nucleotide disphospho-sugar-binding domain-containing protein [Pirellulales bacterium]|nr:nucleotide disphospho-sugar-binding domain-containing protein [Pirellulales bacterium]
MSRVVITTFGSLGDLHPYLAIGLELTRRGHEAIVATAECYRDYVVSRGLGFRAVRPDCDWLNDPERLRRFMHLRFGLIRLVRELVFPVLRESYDDLLDVVDGADLLVSQAPLAARLVAEKTGIKWASTIHIPLFFFSACDQPLLPLAPLACRNLRFLGPSVWRPMFQISKRATRVIARPWYALRGELGLPRASGINCLGDSHSPTLVLALFSKLLSEKQPDWPDQSLVTGFPFYDGGRGGALPADLAGFLESGPPPIVFTLGTAVSTAAGTFFQSSAAAARRLGRRAVLVVTQPRNRPTELPDGVMAVDYAPFTELFARAAAIVHHGGIGTTGLAMRAGRPTLVVPHSWDQPDNADRVRRLGVARVLSPRQYTPDRAAHELSKLLEDESYSAHAHRVADQMRHEDGVTTACDELEKLL